MIHKVGNVILLGTSHVAKQSIKDIENAVTKYNPSIIAIELDIDRLKQLLSNKKNKQSSISMIKQIGVFGFLFGKIAGLVQKSIGKSLNVTPGLDMKAAYKIGRKNKIPTALIDQHIQITLMKLSKLSLRKKTSILFSLLFKGMKKKHRNNLPLQLKKGEIPSPEDIEKILEFVKIEAPDFYKILIEDRNEYMCKKIEHLQHQNPDSIILAVVGAGHIKGMKDLLLKKEPVVTEDNAVSFSFSIDSH